jgi:hypothetical protein
VAEFDRRLHLAALDQIGIGLEDRIDLLGSGNLLAIEHAAAPRCVFPKAVLNVRAADCCNRVALGAHEGAVHNQCLFSA